MPINVFGNSNSNNSDNKIDTSLFVQKPYLRHNYIEANIEEDINLKNQYRIKNLIDPINLQDARNKNYIDNIYKNDIDFNDVKLGNIKFVKVNYAPALPNHLTPKVYVDASINESSLVRNNQDNDFNNNNLTNINSITFNKQAENDNQVITKAYVDQFHQENERSRRDLGIDFYNESNDLVRNNQDNDINDKRITNLDSITVNRNPSLDNELANKKYIDDSIAEGTLLRFNQTLTNYLKVTGGNDTYNLTKYNKIQLTDVTEIRSPNSGYDLLPKWRIKNLHENNGTKAGNFLKSTVTNSPTSYSGATSLPPIGSAFMYIEISSNNHGHERVFVSWERTDIIQISNITFYYNRFSILTNDSLKSMGLFRIQLLLEDNTWSTRYNIPKNDRFSDSSTEWTLVSLNFTIENYGIKLIYDEIDTPHADMCFSNITITHSVN